MDITGVSKWGPLAINFQINSGAEEKASTVTAGQDAKWSGFGLQPVYTFSDTFSLGARYESFEDKGGTRGLNAKDATNITLTPAWKFSDPATLRAEVRKDSWTTMGGASKASTTIGAELIYTF